MMRLCKIEWLKIKTYRSFWMLIGLFSILFFGWNYAVIRSFVDIGEGSMKFLSNVYSFPQIWSNMSYLFSFFVLFLCVFVIISVSNEFSFKTNKQHIIDGLTRLEFLHAKVLLVVGICLFAVLLLVLNGLLFGFWNGGGNPMPNSEKILHALVYTVNYVSFSAFLAFFVRRSGLSIILLFAYFLLESILSGFINFQFDTQLGNLLPLQCSDELLPLPAMKSIGNLTGSTKPNLPTFGLVAASLVYIGMYYTILRWRLLTSDI